MTISDWGATPEADVRAYLRGLAESSGYEVLLLPDGWSVGAEHVEVLHDAQSQLGGEVL